MERQDFKFEVCANGVESCLAAQEGGADRVELCAGIPEGGTTPSYGEIKVARETLTRTRLHVIIRPRGGDFLYTPLQLQRMEEDIKVCRQLGVDGVVFGCLNRDGNVDTAACERLMPLCEGISVTFHRAFDRCADPFRAMDDIIRLGFHRILTSGQQPHAIDGAPLLRQLQQRADGRIIILAGSGINESNIRQLQTETGVREFHFSLRELEPSAMAFSRASFEDEDAPHAVPVTSARRVSAAIAAVCGATAESVSAFIR